MKRMVAFVCALLMLTMGSAVAVLAQGNAAPGVVNQSKTAAGLSHKVEILNDFPYINQEADDKPAPVYELDDSVKYDYDVSFTTRGGRWTEDEGVFTSASANSLAVNTSTPFRYGTYSCFIKPNSSTDNGLVFCFSGNGSWESGNSYYFFFLDRNGGAYLGKVSNGVWSEVSRVVIGQISSSRFYELKVVLLGNKILCYVDDEMIFGVKDNSLLPGSGYGIRAGGTGVVIRDIAITSDYVYGSND